MELLQSELGAAQQYALQLQALQQHSASTERAVVTAAFPGVAEAQWRAEAQ